MQRRSKIIRLKGSSGTKDRLRDMPDEIIVHILSFMPTLDAVKTMLLRRFGNLWTLVPTLEFDFDEFDSMLCADDDIGDDGEPSRSIQATFPCFARFIRNVLILHRRLSINTFHLHIIEFCEGKLQDPEIPNDVKTWLRFATEREVKYLDLVFNGVDILSPPRFIFTSQSLHTLSLSGCILEHYEHQPLVQMRTLRKLSLKTVEGSNEAFNHFISGCPSLQELNIDKAKGLQILNITTPSVSKLHLCICDVEDKPFSLNCPLLKFLSIAVDRSCQKVNFVDASSLQEVYVESLPKRCSSGDVFKSFLTHFRNVEVFTLSSDTFEQLSLMTNMNFPQNRWKRLVLQSWWNQDSCLEIIFNLVKCSATLEELILYTGRPSYRDDASFYHCPELSTCCVMPRLKAVIFHGYGKWCEERLQLVEFLLRNAVVLQKLQIIPGRNKLTAAQELKFVKQVSGFRRASASATVVFS